MLRAANKSLLQQTEVHSEGELKAAVGLKLERAGRPGIHGPEVDCQGAPRTEELILTEHAFFRGVSNG